MSKVQQIFSIHGLFRNAVLFIQICILCMFMTGCSGLEFQTKDGVKHHLIVGVGMISVKEQKGVSVEDVKSLGISLGKGGINLGIGQQHYVDIDPKTASDAVILIRSTPYSLKVINFNPYSSIHSSKGGNKNEKQN